MGLREEILANQACNAAVAAKDCATIAAIMSVGRNRRNSREIGNGTILETLGIAAGNAFLDVLLSSATDSPYRHVKPLIEQGRLLIGSVLVQATVQSMVAQSVLTQAQADALCALGLELAPLSAQDVAEALYNVDGSPK
jgi:hypothetical protein